MPEELSFTKLQRLQSPMPKPTDSAGTASGHRTSLPLQFPAKNHRPTSSQTNKRVGHEQARHTPEPRANLGLHPVNIVELVRLAFLRCGLRPCPNPFPTPSPTLPLQSRPRPGPRGVSSLEAIRFVVLASLWKPQQTNP
ncbi:hypothetical protein K456DRAFT_571329 [Colletotrichum gloeosporioides 23]|nr:hypothetical protein K456DRAFT_571329 [Colletotrichum gloeosporioides 23]